MSRTGFILRLLLALGALWAGGLFRFADEIDRLQPATADTDAIVVLTGSAGRVSAGLGLLRGDPGRRMLISGIGSDTNRAALEAAHPGNADLFDCCVDLGPDAQDTVGNAVEIAFWVRQHRFTSLTVVTAVYHMPRSLVELRRVLGDVRLEPWPTRRGDDDPGRWWHDSATFRRVTLEFHKYVFSLVRARLTSDIGDVRL